MTEIARREPAKYLRDLWTMSKPGINALVLITTFGGYALADPSRLLDGRLVWTLLGTALTVAAASFANHLAEMRVDARMERTRDRPLPSGRVSPWSTSLIASVLGPLGLAILMLGANGLAAFLALIAILTYVPMYTYMKRVTSLATLFGAVPGALPPVIGWVAVRGTIDLPAVVLFVIMFLWQPPHFLALALMLKQDYEEAKLPMLPVEHDEQTTRRQITIYTAALVPASLFPVLVGVSGLIYGFVVGILGLLFLAMAVYGNVLGDRAGRSWARGLFFFSIGYLAVLFVFIFLNPSEGSLL